MSSRSENDRYREISWRWSAATARASTAGCEHGHGQLAVCGDVAAGEESAPGNPFCFRSFTPHWEQVGRSSTHED
jgi:hypothetical protein